MLTTETMHPPRRIQLRLSLLLFICIVILCMPLTATAQSPSQAITMSDDQIAAWIGRESSIEHPAIDGLASQNRHNLQFYIDKNYAQRAKSVIDSADTARQKTIRFLPPETLDNITIYLLGDMNDYFKAQDAPGRAPQWASGLAILRDGVILIRLTSVGTARMEPEKTLAHELNHVALRRYANESAFPHWFYEGFAMLATDDWTIERANTLANASMSGHILRLDELNDAFSKHGVIVDLAYAQSAHFVSWLAHQYGDSAIQQLLAGVAAGDTFDASFFAAFNRSPNAAYALWFDAKTKHQSIIGMLFSPEGLFSIVSLFAALGLIFALRRRNRIKKRRYENAQNELSLSALPENLRHFGPFMNKD